MNDPTSFHFTKRAAVICLSKTYYCIALTSMEGMVLKIENSNLFVGICGQSDEFKLED